VPHLANPKNRRLNSLAELKALPLGTRIRVIFDPTDDEVGEQTGVKDTPSRGRQSIRWDDGIGGGGWLPSESAFASLVVEVVTDDSMRYCQTCRVTVIHEGDRCLSPNHPKE
jgi:hypothetical protein